MPLDHAFKFLSKRRDIKCLRYMDDVKVLARDMASAREALFLMNDKLRELRLNIQGSKTRIIEGAEIREELFDGRLNAVNEIIDKIQKKSTLTPQEREKYVADLKRHLKSVRGRKGIIRDKELRLFRRLMTGFTLLRNSEMVRLVLDQLERNPDSRLLNSSVRYLRIQDRNFRTISDRLVEFLTKSRGLFPYQTAHFLMSLRYVRDIPPEAWKEARRQIRLKNSHWYVRQQAALLLGLKKLRVDELQTIQKILKSDEKLEVKRALVQALTQLPVEKLQEVVRDLVFATDPNLQRLGRFCHGLLFDRGKGLEQVQSIFNEFKEEILLDRFFEVELLSKSKDNEVRRELLRNIRKRRRDVRRPMLKKRINEIENRIKAAFQEKSLE